MTVIRVPHGSIETEYIDVDAFEYLVHMLIRDGDEQMMFTLDPADARALAAALVHQASEVKK